MNRAQFDRIIRSAAAISGTQDIIVIGSQSILGWHPELDQPDEIVGSADLDIEPLGTDESVRNEIRGVLGELSDFQRSNDGAYADAVAVEELAVFPTGWRDRLLPIETPNLMTVGRNPFQSRALCLHPNDLVVSKMLAQREKDLAFCSTLVGLDLPELDEQSILDGINDVAGQRPQVKKKADVAAVLIARWFSALEASRGPRDS
jgi:hypothetical protein